MKPLELGDLLPLDEYERERDAARAKVMANKRVRYVALGEHMTALFENRESVWLQVQEMLRTERIVKESAILHELETYNELMPAPHELSLTVFVEYEQRDERERMLAALAGLETHFSLEFGGERAALTPDRRGGDPARTLAVHYVKFTLSESLEAAVGDGQRGVLLGVEHPVYRVKTELRPETLLSLRADLRAPH